MTPHRPTRRTDRTGRTGRTGRTALVILGTILATTSALAACASEDMKSSASLPSVERGVSDIPADATPDATASSPTSLERPLGLDTLGRQLIVNATVGVRVADVGNAVTRVVDLAVRHGGQVYDSRIDLGDPDRASGTLVLRLPPGEVDAAIAELADLGTVVSRSQSTDDVTDVVVDVEARLLTARASVLSIRSLMERTTDLNQVVFLESELTNRETVVEQLLAQQRNLAGQVALATLTVELSTLHIVEPEPAKHDKGISDAFATGWDGFITVVVGIVIAIGYASPFLAAGLVMGGVVALFSRARRRRLPAQPPRNRSAAPLLPPVQDADPQTTEPDSVGAARNP